ncbi:MAG: NUDIX domain-containing protein [Patescibacteria group bacterium]
MTELLDILDENGQLTGRQKPRDQVHRDGDWHRSAHIWIINSQKELLIQKRSANKDSHPNQWDISSAGHVQAGDDYLISALRELEEELGLVAKKESFESLGIFKDEAITNNGAFINKQFNEVFLIEMDLDIAELKLQEEEVAEVKFIPFTELEKIIAKGDENFVAHQEQYKVLFSILRKKYGTS